MRIVICTEGVDDASGSFSGAIARAFENNKSISINYYFDTSNQSNVLPLDGDLYLIHGNVKADFSLLKHLSPKRLMHFGAAKSGAYNAPLDGIELRLTGTYGSDHGSLTKMQLNAITERLKLIATLPEILYHISPNGGLQGVWRPKLPDGTPTDAENTALPDNPVNPTKVLFTETHAPRICTSTTIEGCFYGVYPNWQKYFDDPRCHHLDFYVYVVAKYRPSEFMNTEELVDKKMVYDAHLSKECNIFGEATMIILPYKVRYAKPKASKFDDRKRNNWIHPYDDVTEAEIYHSPKVEYKWMRP